MYRRTVEFTTGNILAVDAYATSPLHEILRDIIVPQEYPLEKVCVPFSPLDTINITAEALLDASQDAEAQYVIVHNPDRLVLSDDAKELLRVVIGTQNTTDVRIEAMVYANTIIVPDDQSGDIRQRLQTAILALSESVPTVSYNDVVEMQRERAKKELLDFVAKRKTDRRKSLKATLDSVRVHLAEASSKVLQYSRSIESFETELVGYESRNIDEELVRVQEALDEMLSYTNLETVKLESSGKLVFTTRNLAMREPDGSGRVRPVGKYVVTLDLNNCALKFVNLDNKINHARAHAVGHTHLVHPHVGASGNPCLGNLATILPELVAAQDFLGIWQVLLSFLTSYNPKDEWGKRAKFWDLYEADGVTLVGPSFTCESCRTAVFASIDGGTVEFTCADCGAALCASCTFNDMDGAHYCSRCWDSKYCVACETRHANTVPLFICYNCDARVCEEKAVREPNSERLFCCEPCREACDDIDDDDDDDDDEEDYGDE